MMLMMMLMREETKRKPKDTTGLPLLLWFVSHDRITVFPVCRQRDILLTWSVVGDFVEGRGKHLNITERILVRIHRHP